MNHALTAILVYLSIVLQSSFVPEVLPHNFQPNLFWLCLLFAVFRLGTNAAVVWAGGIGLAAASVSGIPIGVEVICFSCICFLMRWFRLHETRSALLILLVSFLSFCLIDGFSIIALSLLETGHLEVFTLQVFLSVPAGTTALFGFAAIIFYRGLGSVSGSVFSEAKIAGNARRKPFVN